ncbi:hypothetical protein CC86DRAFT_366459 [Ophiobolus disseminans]|uniref:Uncharacterized protein n=1 Tax=Ophiobolus disseminans TaxID=1469910 RepID=A0A6A7ACB6_9PLEO|nr:hypothetical protein CC86DRAFT_366459 [Ophiobolus disseminans]
MPPLPFTPAHIAIGGIYNIRPETQYEALGYETDITLPARHHKVLVIGAAPERVGYWRVMTAHLPRPMYQVPCPTNTSLIAHDRLDESASIHQPQTEFALHQFRAFRTCNQGAVCDAARSAGWCEVQERWIFAHQSVVLYPWERIDGGAGALSGEEAWGAFTSCGKWRDGNGEVEGGP